VSVAFERDLRTIIRKHRRANDGSEVAS
jgi:hypothetical protein